MSEKHVWGFVIKRRNCNESLFGFTYADTEDEAKANVLESLNEKYKDVLQFNSLTEMDDGYKTYLIAGIKGLGLVVGTPYGRAVGEREDDKKTYKFKAKVKSTGEVFYGVVKATDKQEVIMTVVNALANDFRRGFHVSGIEEIFSNPNYPIDIIGGK